MVIPTASNDTSVVRTSGIPMVLCEGEGLVMARVNTLLSLGDPVGLDMWRVGVIEVEDIPADPDVLTQMVALEGMCPIHARLPRDADPLLRPECRACEVGRVAWFMHRSPDITDEHPISLDAGFGPFVPDWPFTDGNHRLFVLSVLRLSRPEVGNETVLVRIDGDWDRGVALLVEERSAEWVYDHL